MSNRLALESSPYLRQHAGNPVDWYPWGEDAFAQARALGRPVHLSIGYFACHWCHVMAHECFENEQIAALLNAEFINIKVDRQERPDIDDLYQRVLRMMGQSGGWPLTVFLTPEQEPFFGGTYFPPQDRPGLPGFPRLLRGLANAWRERQGEVRENCAQFLRGFVLNDEQLYIADGPPPADAPALAAMALARETDRVHGGLGGAPKFPNPCVYDLLLRVRHRTGEPALSAALERTLDAMAAGGIHDHLGGGFARYSVDDHWTVPHFEKMLYDNALLMRLYADGYRAMQKPQWRTVFEDVVDYVLRDLAHAEGGFFAGEDADSEGEEGRFYVWNPAQIQAALGAEEGAFACRAFGVSVAGNFERGYSVLQRTLALADADAARLQAARVALLAARDARVRPGRDENILAGWNGLMIQGLCAAYQATGEERHLRAARRAADFLRSHLVSPGGGLWRSWRDGTAKVPGFLEDYSFLANGLLDLYESDFQARDLEWALALVERILEEFWDDGLYFTARSAAALIHRPIAPFDNAWPSGHSQSVFALLRAHELRGVEHHRQCALRVLERFASAAARNPFGFSHLLAAQEFAQGAGAARIAIAGSSSAAAQLIRAVHERYLPARVLARAQDVAWAAGDPSQGEAGGALAYVCRGNTCLPAIAEVAALGAALDAPQAPET